MVEGGVGAFVWRIRTISGNGKRRRLATLLDKRRVVVARACRFVESRKQRKTHDYLAVEFADGAGGGPWGHVCGKAEAPRQTRLFVSDRDEVDGSTSALEKFEQLLVR